MTATTEIPATGWVLILVRIWLMVLLLLFCAPLHYLWRLLGLSRFWPRVFLGGVGWIAGLRITRHGAHARGALILANHVSWLDIPAIARASGSAFVGHDGLASMPLLRHLCAMNDTVFIARHHRGSVAAQADRVRLAVAETGALTLFPEGTTSDGTGLLPFKSSLLAAIDPLPEGLGVQPVLLAYHDAPEVSWVGEEHGLDNFKRILGRWRPWRLTVHFLPPLHGPDLADRKAMARAASAAIAKAMEGGK